MRLQLGEHGHSGLCHTPHRLRTARGVVVEEAAFFRVLKPGTCVALSHADDPDVWHEALITWPFLGVDRAAAILTPDDDHCVELGECGTLLDRTL